MRVTGAAEQRVEGDGDVPPGGEGEVYERRETGLSASLDQGYAALRFLIWWTNCVCTVQRASRACTVQSAWAGGDNWRATVLGPSGTE